MGIPEWVQAAAASNQAEKLKCSLLNMPVTSKHLGGLTGGGLYLPRGL